MKIKLVREVLKCAFAACAVFAAMNGEAMDAYDFEKAWKDVDALSRKGLPRSVTNKVKEISHEAIAASRWPDAARAFLVREKMMESFTDELPKVWLTAFAASVDAQPAPVQAVLQLHLAHTYVENSSRWRWGGAAPTKLDDEAAADKMPPWSPEKIASTVEAQLEKTFACSEELKKQKMAEWTILFDRGNLPESYCPTLFDFAVRDAIKFYGETVPDDTLEKGIALYNKLIAFHREDGNVDALAMAELDCAEYVRSFDSKPDKVLKALFAAFLDSFLKRYEGKTDVVSIAAAKKANLMREGNGDLVTPHALASKYAARYPKSIGGKMCANVVAQIESKSLSVETERNWCTPLPDITVKARNVTEVHFRLVKVSFDDLVEDKSMGVSGYGSDEMKDKYLKRKAVKEWKETLPLKPDFSEQSFSLPAPQGLPLGHYILYAAGNKKFGADKEPLFAQHVTQTSLALVLDTGNRQFRGTVYYAESGIPVEGATVELWGPPPRGGRFKKLREKYVTDADGRFTAKFVTDNGLPMNRNVRVVKDGDEVLSLKSEGPGWSHDEAPVFDHMEIFTDRSLYRPGQEINVKGIAYHANPHTRDFHTYPNELVLVTLSDPNGKEVESKRIRTNKWGSFVYKFTAPTDRLTGRYTVMARVVLAGGKTGENSKTVNVEEYKRPKFLTSLENASDAATLGSPVTVTGIATTYSGLPVQKAKVEWHVSRTTRYPRWWSWFGGRDEDDDDGEGFIAQGEAETDMSGGFKVTFTPVASPKADLDGDPSFDFTVTATVTDQTGEAHVASQSFEIGTVAWRAELWSEGQWHTSSKPVTAKVALKSLAGEPVPVKGKIKAFRLKAPEKPVRTPAQNRNYYASTTEKKGPWDWKSWETGEEVFALDIDSAKAEKWTGELKLGTGAYRLVFEATDPNGKTVKDYDSVFVFDPAAKELGIAVPQFFQAERTSVKVGETLRAYWGTGYTEGYCRVKVTNNGKTILDKAVSGENPTWFYELPIKDEHRGELRIETTFVRENRIYYEHDTINIPWDNKYIDITAEHLTSKLVPGGEATWKFKVSGPAEVLAFMYDKSLDAYKWHDVSLGFSSHFTPWTRWLGSPSLQNAIYDADELCGKFPTREYYANIQWPSWKRIYGALIFRKAARGFAPAAAAAGGRVCYAMACEEADAAGEVFCREPAPAGAPPADNAEDVVEAQPRKNLKETAFFFPNLETDIEGRVSFTFTVPDALTGWKLLMVAHDNALGHGVLRNDEIVTTKPLMCEPAAPRFAREGDDFLFAVKVTNTEDVPQKGEVSLSIEEMVGSARRADRNGKLPESQGNVDAARSASAPYQASDFSCPPQSFELAPHESKTFEFRLAIPDGCGFLKYVAKAKGTAFADGEEGILPVLSRRILVREAVQLNARGKETKSFRLENLVKSKDSDTIRHHDLTVRAVSRPAWYAVLSLPYLMEFPHECCEQTFSRYYANALAEYIANADPRIRATFDAWKAAGGETLKSPLETDPHLKTIALESTPWVREAEHEGAARARLGDLFGKKRLAAEQKRCIEKLRQTKVGGLWPWFPGGYPSDGITLYILTGFARLNFLADIAYPDFFADSCVALDSKVSEYVKKRLKKENLPFHIDGFDIRWLYLHSFKGVAAAKDKSLVPLFVKHLREEWTDFSLSSQALAAIAMKRMGEEALAKEIMASVKERAVLSDELGMYWKVPYFFSSSVFAAPVSTQALIVEAFREVTGDEESAEACCVWLLKQKQTQDWTTTAATADAIYALLLDGSHAGRAGWTDLLAGDTLAEVTLGGEKVKPGDVEAGTGMCSVRYGAKDISPEKGVISFTGAGEKGVSWGGVHWSYFEDVLKVRAHEPKELRVEKKYYKKVKGPDGTRLTKIEGKLEPGDEIVARLEITSDRSYEFVHLSDERPACAEPEDVLSSYRWRDGVGYYQSTHDTATHYYIDRLNKGVFVLETSYRVRQRGTFVGGLATIQCMYAPEFTAHSTAETVHVGKTP